ncbi:MAG: PadR family transcriptional regulator [Clostridia bacterium]|nr:PadR family transcriptional regulator [Clostridia bacterium]
MEQHAISSDLIRGHIDTIILYSLVDSDKFAQQISDSIESKSNKEYKINQATLYSSLKRLENLKYVDSYWLDADNGRRKFFHLTEKGNEVVKNNLFGWNYSKGIIDLLMGCENVQQEPKIVYVEKTVEAIPQPVVLQQKNEEIPQTLINKEPEPTTLFEKPPVMQNNSSSQQQRSTETNFRLVLNSLLPTNKKINHQKPEIIEENKPTAPNIDEKEDVLSLSEKLVDSDYKASSVSYNGKIDFGDLKIKAAQEGYKIRISSKDSAMPDGALKMNKLNMWTAILMFLICCAQFIPVYVKNANILSVKAVFLVVFTLAIAAYPIVTIIKKITCNEKLISRLYNDSIFTCAIIVFNVLLINIAITFLANMDFSVKSNLLKFIYAPVVLTLNSLVFMILRFILSKSKIFYKNNK